MQIQVETVYSLPVLTAMARALRKTLRRKKSRRTRIFSVVLMLIALLTIVLSLTTDPSFPAIISRWLHHHHPRGQKRMAL